jgi:hypothetical protein
LNFLYVPLTVIVLPHATMAGGEAMGNTPLILYSPASLRRHQLPPVSIDRRRPAPKPGFTGSDIGGNRPPLFGATVSEMSSTITPLYRRTERWPQASTRRAGEAHNARNWRSYLKGCPTAAAEWENSAPGYFLTKE